MAFKTAYLQLHRICDQDCIFCAQPTNGSYLNKEQIQSQIDYYISQDYSGIIFSGGEPSMSPYFFDTVDYCKKKDFSMRILTNGHKFAENDFTKRSISLGLLQYHVSIHSHIESIHDAMVKKKGSFQRSLLAMRQIIQNNGELTINITINNYNVSYFPKLVSFFLKNFPHLKGFIINNLETSQIETSHFNVIAPLSKIKKIIIPTLSLIQKYNKEVRVERVPLCYMRGYEEYSTDVELSLMDEVKFLHYLDPDTVSGTLNADTYSADYTYGLQCQKCDLKGICGGIAGLGVHYHQDDLQTQKLSFDELEKLKNKIKLFLGA